MYIKSIKAQGFKSFADKMELDFNSGIVAIVGPNGSGKSNVVDAILWVLGEQSVKSLRGDSNMTDVIFSGSKSREELKKASVAIILDNSDHNINSDFSEIEIKRVIYATGENEYYINGVKVRLKDIQDLLIDVTSKFNIISQGNISALVENKSSERRSLFESAAGVLKYKKRKEESLRKLDNTKENITRISLIIKEILTSLNPLEKQKKDAEKYLNAKQSLEQIEISLIAHDITNYSLKYEELKANIDVIQKKLEDINFLHPISLEKIKLERTKNEEEINKLNQELLVLSKEIGQLNSEKQISLERAKFNLEKDTIDSNIIELNESKLEFERNISLLDNEINNYKNDLQKEVQVYNELYNNNLKNKIKISSISQEYSIASKELLELQNKINIEKSNLDNDVYMPKSVKSILSGKFPGVYNTIGNVISVNEAHAIAINTALSSSKFFLIVDNMNSAKTAINYLKDNKLGRATFFPLDTIKSRKIAADINYTLQSLDGFLGIASDLVNTDDKYKNIIENQLGSVLVADTINNMIDIAKVTEYHYKVVSLDGEIIFPGGSIAGGDKVSSNEGKNLLNTMLKSLESKKAVFIELENSINSINKEYEATVAKINDINGKITTSKITIENKESEKNYLMNKLNEINSRVNGLNDITNNETSNRINTILNTLNNKIKAKEIAESNLKSFQSKKFDIDGEIESIEKQISEQNSSYHKLESTLKDSEVEKGKIEIKLENLLNVLSQDYNITYEYANANYSLDIDEEIARSKVASYRNELKGLSNVNIGSIDEYKRLKTRYDFLEGQKNDLDVASLELINIIEEMDNIMKDKFKSTFEKISIEFSKVFRIMFKGGNGLLKLADENDLLNTGINIIALPPGKKLNSTAALSGGEKALTAICLLFAILNVKPVPFIVLDEAEAALDEENVNMFGDYLKSMKEHSQFILITHKKKMMEYADALYGITMQESGVSKLVSVKLD